MNINSKIVIKNLYKESLKTVHGLGYRYGSLIRINHKNWICEEKILSKRRFRKLYNNDELGSFLAVNIRFQYDMAKEVRDEKTINKLIEEGFSALRTLNYITWYIEKKEKEEKSKKIQK